MTSFGRERFGLRRRIAARAEKVAPETCARECRDVECADHHQVGAPMEFKAHPLAALQDLNKLAAFNQWCGLEVVSAEPGQIEITLPWKRELGQYSGFLHAGLVATLIDTACGFAAATLAGGNLLASHFSVNCLRPAIGEIFSARARVVKPGKSQIFTACELFANSGSKSTLVATGETLLLVTGTNAQA